MKRKLYLLISVILASAFCLITAQEPNKSIWNNHKCAVVLTYDDGLNVHLDKVIPSLDSVGIKGTFFIPGNSPTLDSRINDWRKAAETGHELGNHTLFHPCARSPIGREWVNKDYDLDNYTLTRMLDELALADVLLKSIDGKEKRTFAYTCGEKFAGKDSFNKLITSEFISARGTVQKFENINTVELFDIGSFMMNGETGEQLINLVNEAMKNNSLLVFLFHGVGGEHSINVSLGNHNELLGYLKKHEKDIWVTTFIEVSEFINKVKSR